MIDFVKPQGSKENEQAADDAWDLRGSQPNLFHPRNPTLHTHAHDHASGVDITKSGSLNKEAWDSELEEAKHKPWNSTIAGRGMIRLFSRGVMGATFFALGGYAARKGLAGYSQFEKPEFYNLPQQIAYHIDHFIGRPLERAANAMGHDGAALVTFRPTTVHRIQENGMEVVKEGLTLGHEVVNLTFDFATMSIGDAMGRDIANAADPNKKQNWIENGHIDYGQVTKNVGYNTWKYLTYNQGEDWAVALPYAFFTRWQRNYIDKLSPGFGYDNDRRLNGGSFKVDNQGKVIGTYGFEGAMDLQTRFTAYNIGTVMFRETYTAAAHHLKDWYHSGFQLPKGPSSISDAVNAAAGAIGKTIRWAARDTVKATLYMTPAVPAFWLFRTPQTKNRALFINQENGAIAFKTGSAHYDVQFLHANEYKRSTNEYKDMPFNGYNTTFFSKHNGGRWNIESNVPNPISPYMTVKDENGKFLQKYPSYDKTYGAFDAMINPIGKFNNKVRKLGHWPIGKINDHFKVNLDTKELQAKRFSDNVINASFAYTPYFFMKSDVMAVQWDTAKMDMAIERAIDGVTGFKTSEIKEGVGEIWNAMWHKPFSDPSREVEAQRRICNDKSPPDGQTLYQNKRCFDEALQDISLHSQYHRHADTKQFVERLQDSKARSRNMLDGFRKDVVDRFADAVGPKSRDTERGEDSFAKRERVRQAQNRDDFPDIGTTVH